MNRTELEKNVAAELGLSQADGVKAVEAVLSNIVFAVKTEPEGARIGGFGFFTAQKKPARTGRNPRTGETIEIPASVGVKFKPAGDLKKILNDQRW